MKLLYKEFALAAHPTLYLFLVLGCLVIVPSYPYTVILFFGCLAPYLTFLFSRETNDTWYTALLPVGKYGSVHAKCLLIVFVQVGQLLFSIPFALLRTALQIPPNPAGIEANVAWYGFGLILYAVFNLIFFPTYYKTGYRAGKAFVLALIPFVPLMLLVETFGHIPVLSWLDSTVPSDLLLQFPVLLFGILCYIGITLLSCRMACTRFAKLDL